MPGRDEKGTLLPEISPGPAGSPGQADKKVQAYNFRIIATDAAANRLAWPRPGQYYPQRYALLARYLSEFVKHNGRSPVFHELTLIALIPGAKADFNNNGPFSTDYIGKNYDYPDGSYARREAIWKEHVDYVQGFYYFLANDPSVPRSLQHRVSALPSLLRCLSILPAPTHLTPALIGENLGEVAAF